MVDLRKRGLVTAVICSDPFVQLAKTQARVFGAADLPLVVIPHPLGGLPLDGVAGRARVATPQVAELIRKHLK